MNRYFDYAKIYYHFKMIFNKQKKSGEVVFAKPPMI